MGSLLRKFQFTLQIITITIFTVFVFAAFTHYAAAQPVNDDCVNAIPIFNGQTLFNNFNANNSAPPFTCSGGFGSTDIWFDYTATCTGDVVFQTCGSATLTDTVLELYDTTNCGDLLGNSVACNDDTLGCGSTGFNSFFIAPVVDGQGYLVRVGGWSGSVGEGELEIIPQENCGAGCAVTVVKSANPADDTLFNFSVDNVPDFTLSDPSDTTEVIVILGGDTITVTEDVPLGWELDDIFCDVTAPAINVSSIENGVELECFANGQARCTFSNQIAARPIPTLSEWSMIAVAVLLGAVGLIYAYRRRKLAV